MRCPLLPSLAALAACGGEDPTTPTADPPKLEVLAPEEGATVSAGDVAFSLVVDDFTLIEPLAWSPTAWLFATAYAHGTGEEGAAGWVSVALDGAEVLTLGETQGVVPDVAAGSHTLGFALIHEDGDPVEPAVTASVSFTAQ